MEGTAVATTALYEIDIFGISYLSGGFQHALKHLIVLTLRRVNGTSYIIEFRRSDLRNNGPQFSPVRRLWPIFYLAHHLIGSDITVDASAGNFQAKLGLCPTFADEGFRYVANCPRLKLIFYVGIQ